MEKYLVIFVSLLCILALLLSAGLVLIKSKGLPTDICLKPGCVKAASSILKYLNKSVDPCSDFYEFACGPFLESTNIPDDEDSVSQISLLDDEVDEQLKTLVEGLPAVGGPRTSKLLRKLYNVCMNTTKIEEDGLSTANDYISQFGGWPVILGNNWNERDFDWKKTLYKMKELGFTSGYLISFYISPDDRNTTRYILKVCFLAEGGASLG